VYVASPNKKMKKLCQLLFQDRAGLLEHLHRCSVRDSRQYNLLWKSQNVPVYLRKFVFLRQSAPFQGWYKAQYSCGPLKKSEINWTWLRLSISDWLIIMKGPGGLLLVIPTSLRSSSYSFIGGDSRNKKQLNLDI